MSTQWFIKPVARSADGRTNVWHVFPGCGCKRFTPPTTMLSRQIVQCPTCGAKALAYYNKGVAIAEPEGELK